MFFFGRKKKDIPEFYKLIQELPPTISNYNDMLCLENKFIEIHKQIDSVNKYLKITEILSKKEKKHINEILYEKVYAYTIAITQAVKLIKTIVNEEEKRDTPRIPEKELTSYIKKLDVCVSINKTLLNLANTIILEY